MAGTNQNRMGKPAAVTVSVASLTTLAEIPANEGAKRIDDKAKFLALQIKNTGATNAFDAFEIQGRAGPDEDYQTMFSTAAQFTTAIQSPLLWSTGSPVTLAAGSQVIMAMELHGLYSVRVQASANSATTTATCAWNIGG